MPPIRGDRLRVEIPEITRDFDGSDLSIVALMKRGIMEWFGLEPLKLNALRVRGQFPDDNADATNQGKFYYRRIGGFKTGSWTLTKLGKFSINEYFYDENGDWQSEEGEFKTITFGMPNGVTMREMVEFLRVRIPTAEQDNMRRIVTPEGVGYNLDIEWETSDPDITDGESSS